MKKQLIIVFCLLINTGAFAQHDHGNMKHDKQKHSKKDHANHDGMKMNEGGITSYQVSGDFQNQLNSVFKESMLLNESFISDGPAKVKERAVQVKTLMGKVDMGLLKTPEAHMDWMMYLKEMNTSLDDISKTSVSEVQKESFASFNGALYKSIKAFGLAGNTAYYQHCPMALNNKGGYWLSKSEEIRNPYLGKMMLTCGSTKETLN